MKYYEMTIDQIRKMERTGKVPPGFEGLTIPMRYDNNPAIDREATDWLTRLSLAWAAALGPNKASFTAITKSRR